MNLLARALSLALALFTFACSSGGALAGAAAPEPMASGSPALGGAGGITNGGSTSTAGASGASNSPGPFDKTACLRNAGTGKTLYVAPAGTPAGTGASFESAYDIASAIGRAAPGDTLLLQAGKYPIAYVPGAKNTLVLAQKGTEDERIRVISEGGRAEVDFSFPDQAWMQDSFGVLVSGSYWSLCGVDITRAGYQGVYVTGEHNTFENCSFHDNRNTGLEINKGGAYTTVINCDSYRNYDPKKMGSMADGFGPKETQGPGNRFVGCRAWENSDDGYDAYNSDQAVIFEGCSAFRNGVDVWNYGGFAGNGNGFKVGGLAKQANHRLTQCVSFANRVKGFDQNNNTGGLTLYNCTGFENGTNFGLGGALNPGQMHDLENNVSFGATDAISNALQKNNSWTLGIVVSETDFKGVDIKQGSAPRAADGSLPNVDFLHLAAASKLIDQGVDVGLPFQGAAPDLGAFEAL
ncbi:MAG TPA: right-handed parallel beta-helix repeat-containing protein [Polyangiaceae bacterium]|nr:right-handed parallel beta-helix repeat-containing protein [Polyangiaceae bacterium]